MLAKIILFLLIGIQECQGIPVIDQSNGQEIDLNKPAIPIEPKTADSSNAQPRYWKIGQTVAEAAREAAKNSGHLKKSETYWKVYRHIYRKARKERNLYFATNFNDEKAKQTLKTDQMKSNKRSTKYIHGIYQRKKQDKQTLKDKHYFDKRVESSRRLYLRRVERQKQKQQEQQNANSSSINPDLPIIERQGIH